MTCLPQVGILLESPQLASQLSYFRERVRISTPRRNMSIMRAEKKTLHLWSFCACFFSFSQQTQPFPKGQQEPGHFCRPGKAGKAKGKVPGNLQCALPLQSSM